MDINKQLKPEPKMKIKSFTFDGKIIIEFDQEMFIPESLKHYKLTTKTIEPD